jgi:DNA-binding transcriptional ArsR family regulator
VPIKNPSSSPLPDILIVDKPEDIKLIFSEKHNRMLKLVMDKEMSISDIAKKLDVNPGSVHYHLKELEKHGLVKQVREEIKGGVVKKYYRTAAKRILLDTPDFNLQETIGTMEKGHVDRLIRSVEYLGYHLPTENREDAEDLLRRYDKKMRDLLLELHGMGLENVEKDGVVLRSAYDLIINIKAKEDPELERMHGEFAKLFLKYE